MCCFLYQIFASLPDLYPKLYKNIYTNYLVNNYLDVSHVTQTQIIIHYSLLAPSQCPSVLSALFILLNNTSIYIIPKIGICGASQATL